MKAWIGAVQLTTGIVGLVTFIILWDMMLKKVEATEFMWFYFIVYIIIYFMSIFIVFATRRAYIRDEVENYLKSKRL